MRSNYKALGDFIREVNIRNTELKVERLLGVSIQKELMPSIANTIGTDMANYKILKRHQFAYGPVTSRNGDKISIALLEDYDEVLISQAYTAFEIIDTNKLHPEYLMMWFRRSEFDRYARFMSHGSAREVFGWDELCNTLMPIPSPEKQREIVAEYNIVKKRIDLNNQLILKLEETAQAIYKQWFVDFEFPDENGTPYKSSGGKMVYNEELDKEIPTGWEVKKIINFGRVITGKTPSSDNPEEFGNEMLFVTPGDFKNFKKFVTGADRKLSQIGYNRLNNKILKQGSVIVTCIGSDMGKVVITKQDCITNQQMNSILVAKGFYSDYLYYYLNSAYNQLKRIALGGSTMPILSKSEFEAISILKPANSLLNKFGKILSPLNEIEFKVSMENKSLAILSSLLLSKSATLNKKTNDIWLT